MADTKRIIDFPTAGAYDGYLLQDKAGGSTTKLPKATLVAGLVAEGLLPAAVLADNAGGDQGAGLVGYMGRTVASRFGDTAHIMDHGAEADSVTDDTAAWVAAQALGLPLQTGGRTYLVSGLTITQPIVDTAHQIFATGSTVTISNGLPVRPEWFGSPSTAGTVRKAVEALPSTGGVVILRPVRYAWSGYGHQYTGTPSGLLLAETLTKSGVSIIGEKVPRFDGADRLVGGSVIEGPFAVYADGFSIDGVGIDSGDYTCDTRWSGDFQEGFFFGIPDEYKTGGPWPTPGNIRVGDIVCLTQAKDSAVHSFLVERAADVSARSIETRHGVWGVAIKAERVRIGRIKGELHDNAAVIVKSDGVFLNRLAKANRVSIEQMYSNATGYASLWIEAGTGGDLPATAIHVGRLEAENSGVSRGVAGIRVVGEGAGAVVDSVRIDDLKLDKFEFAWVHNTNTTKVYRTHIGRAELSDILTSGITPDFADAACQMFVGEISAGNCTLPLRALNYASVRVGAINEWFPTTPPTIAVTAEDNSRVSVGSMDLLAGTAMHPSGSFAFANGSTQYAGATIPACTVFKAGYKNHLSGLLVPGSSTDIATIAREFRPAKDLRFAVTGNVGGSVVILEMNVQANGVISISTIASVLYISLDGVSW